MVPVPSTTGIPRCTRSLTWILPQFAPTGRYRTLRSPSVSVLLRCALSSRHWMSTLFKCHLPEWNYCSNLRPLGSCSYHREEVNSLCDGLSSYLTVETTLTSITSQIKMLTKWNQMHSLVACNHGPFFMFVSLFNLL